MKNIVKNIFPYIPKWLRRFLYRIYENHYIKRHDLYIPKSKMGANKRILFYHISGLSFGGTEKFLQVLAKNIDKSKYEVFFMYSPETGEGRKDYLRNSLINFVPFSFQKRTLTYPFYLEGMKPTLGEVLQENHIDLLVTAGSGYSEYPFNEIENVPIIMLNIFGSPSTKKNIVKQVSISHEVENKVLLVIPKEKSEVMYIPSERPNQNSEGDGQKLRLTLGLHQGNMLFGRIGRADDAIFDPIGIMAFGQIVKKYPHAHYLVVSPPPALIKLVEENKIPNVHVLSGTSDEERIWAFHFAIDALAHFRFDGESCGLNIIESMIAGKPIITHRSPIWNAQLEYLDQSFSRIAKMNDAEEYASYMEEFILLREKGKLNELGARAKEKSAMFLIENNIKRFERWIDESVVE